MRDRIHAATPEPADFLLGPQGERTVFSLEGVTGIRFDQQTQVDPAVSPRSGRYRNPAALPMNAHMFMVSIGVAAFREISLAAQAQIANFFFSDGETIIHPEPARFFEVPIQGPLPEGLNYIP